MIQYSHGRNVACRCGSGKKYKRCCDPRRFPDLSKPNGGLPEPATERAALARALTRMAAAPQQDEDVAIGKVNVGRTRLTCAPIPTQDDGIALPGTAAPPTAEQIETKYEAIRASNSKGATEVIVTYTYPEFLGWAEARMAFDADEFFQRADGPVVSVLELSAGLKIQLADGAIGTVVAEPELRFEIPSPPLPAERGLWTSRVVGKVRHTSYEICEFQWGGQVVRVTPGHPVWSADRRGWVGANELMPGEMIRVAGNQFAPVEGQRLLPGHVEVYGIEVEYFHNYFVGTGENAMLVHNGPECIVKPAMAETVEVGGPNPNKLVGRRVSLPTTDSRAALIK